MSSTVLDVLRQKQDEIQSRFGVARIGVFGSSVHGKAHAHSDVDVLVEFRRAGFNAYMDLKFYLQDLLGRPVDQGGPPAVDASFLPGVQRILR